MSQETTARVETEWTESRIAEAQAKHGFGLRPQSIDEFEAEVEALLEPARRATAAKGLPVLDLVCAASLADQTLEPRSFVVPGLMPGRDVTLISGEGGVGKSLLALMLAEAVATGGSWLNIDVASGPAIYVSAEDELEEVHRRLAAITAAEGRSLGDLHRLHILSLAGLPAVMAAGKSGGIEATPLWKALALKVDELRPALLILDNSADCFSGNELNRVEVRQFVGILRALALNYNCAVGLLSHPSLTGIKDQTGLSGSTAWHGSVRARLYLTHASGADGEVADPDARILQCKKSNYGPIAAELKLWWSEGRFVNETGVPPSRLDKATVEAKAEAVFLDLLQQFQIEGRSVSANPGHSYAPAVFAKHADGRGVPKNALKSAMDRLLKTKHVKVETTGPSSRRVSRLSFVNENDGQK